MEQELQDEIGEWSDSNFDNNIDGVLAHLKEEVEDLMDDPYDPEAFADVHILFMVALRKMGFNMEDLYTAVRAKHNINIYREWLDPDHQGVIRHK